MRLIFKVIVLCAFILKSKGQVNEFYFNDTEIKEGGKIQCHLQYNKTIIIGGNSFDKIKNYPTIIRVDTLGNTLWSTAINDTTNYGTTAVSVYNMISGKDGFLYAYCGNGTVRNEVWKIDPSNGNILIKKKILAMYTVPRFMFDCDSTKFAFAYFSGYTGFGYRTKMAFINKLTCDTISTHYLGMNNDQFAAGIDKQKNIYYSLYDTLCKRHLSNFNTLIYKTKHAAAQVSDYQLLYCDSATASVFLVGKKQWPSSYGKIVKANASTGAYISNHGSYSDVNGRDLKVWNDYIYVAWRHLYVGSGTKPFCVTKYKMSTGIADWDKFYPLVGLGTPDVHSGSQQAVMSLDIDNTGNAYLTGYYGDANYGPENWGIVKLNSSNGNVIFEKTIAEDTVKYNNLSVGMAACVINNKAYFVGELETYFVNYYEREKLTMVRLNENTGSLIFKKYLGGSFQFPSKTLDIQRYSNSKTLVMKQTGRFVEVEMYDFSKILLWKKNFSRSYFLTGGQITSNANGDIFFTAASRTETTTVPYYSTNIDSMYIFHLNASGNTVKAYSFTVNLVSAAPLEIHADNSSAIMLYHKNNVIYLRNVSSSTMSAENNTQISYSAISSKTKYLFNKSIGKAYLFGQKSGSHRMIDLNKSTLVMTNTSIIPLTGSGTNWLNQVQEIDTNKVLISGRDFFFRESITYYNTTTKDTIWKRSYSTASSQMVKCLVDPLKQFIYSVSSNSNNIVVRKISLSNGAPKWTYTYNGAANLTDFPMDMVHDSLQNQIIVTGYETNATNKQVLIFKLDTAGNPLTTITKIGDFAGDNSGTCTNVLFDGTQWIGGNLNKNPHGLAGFIFELNNPVYSLLSAFSTATNLCTGQNIQFNDLSSNSPTTWSWLVTPSTGVVINSPSSQNPNVSVSSPGTYSFSLTAGNGTGPGTTFTQTLTINPSPTITVTNSIQTICLGQPVSFTASGASLYSWSHGGGTSATTVYTPTTTTVYTVTGTSGSCSSNAVSTASVLNLPTLSLSSSSTLICVGQTATLSVNGATSYTWNTSATTNSIIITPSTTTTYSVVGYDSNGCSSTDTISQSVSLCTQIKDYSSFNQINYSPIPASDNLSITVANLDPETIGAEIHLFNSIGQEIIKTVIKDKKNDLDLRNVAAGLYYIIIEKENKILVSDKILKE